MNNMTLSKQTVQEVLHPQPQPDNGFLWHNNIKKTEKVRIQFSSYTDNVNLHDQRPQHNKDYNL